MAETVQRAQKASSARQVKLFSLRRRDPAKGPRVIADRTVALVQSVCPVNSVRVPAHNSV